MALSVGDTYLVKSTGPVVMHIGFVAAVDGAGHQSGHFQLHQSYLPIRIRDEALVGGVTSLIGSAPVRETPQTQTPTPMLCRQPSVARVPRSFSQEEDWLSKACRSGARTSSTALTQRYEEEKLGTVQDTRRLTRLVLRLQPSESRASCCGSCFCHSRPSQRFTIREHVRLLWVFEDEKVLRAHNGVCYLYVDQSWEIFSGLISEVCLERVQQSMQALEGLLRSLPMGTFARYRELCGSRGAIVRGSGSCVWPRVCHQVTPARDDSDGADYDVHRPAPPVIGNDAHAGAHRPWHVHAAQAVLRYSCSMQVELLGKRLISYFTEWCGAEYKPTEGFAATDSCWFFVDEGPPFMKATAAAPEKNMFLSMPHPMRDPVLESAESRVLGGAHFSTTTRPYSVNSQPPRWL